MAFTALNLKKVESTIYSAKNGLIKKFEGTQIIGYNGGTSAKVDSETRGKLVTFTDEESASKYLLNNPLYNNWIRNYERIRWSLWTRRMFLKLCCNRVKSI